MPLVHTHPARLLPQLERQNSGNTHTNRGIWYEYDFKQQCAASGIQPALPPGFGNGYCDPDFFILPGVDGTLRNVLHIPRGVDASEALPAFLNGPTVCECFSIILAAAYQAVLATLRQPKFNALFGSRDSPVLAIDRLCIEGAGTFNRTNPIYRFLKRTTYALLSLPGEEGNRPVQKGDFAYFLNHPDYTKRHPAPSSPAAGWNVVCVDDTPGRQLWSGFGLGEPATEAEVLERMAGEYRKEPTEADKSLGVKAHVDPKAVTVELLRKTKMCGFLPVSVLRLDEAAVANAGAGLQDAHWEVTRRRDGVNRWIVEAMGPVVPDDSRVVPAPLEALARRGLFKNGEEVLINNTRRKLKLTGRQAPCLMPPDEGRLFADSVEFEKKDDFLKMRNDLEKVLDRMGKKDGDGSSGAKSKPKLERKGSF